MMNEIISKKYFIILFFLITKTTIAQKQPNLVIIHTDEHNFRTLSCYRDRLPKNVGYVWGAGLGVETPNIDRIADEGAICMNYYAASPVCAPSRGSMLTGLYRQSHGVIKNSFPLRKDVKTLGHVLSDNGYQTSYVGKWHLDELKDSYKFGIKYKAGFKDNKYMMTGGHAPYFNVTNNGVKVVNEKNAKNYAKGDLIHVTDYFVEKTIDIIKRDKEKPFCVMVSIPDPHTPDYAKPPYDTMYKDMDLQMPETMLPENIEKRPIWAKGGKNDALGEGKKGFQVEKLKQYFGMVKHIDDRVGDILKFLDENNLTENTIIVFTSDHGDMFYEHGKLNKGNPYQASSKIGFVIRYPEKIKKGKVINKAYSNVSFTPTMLGLMGITTSTRFEGKDRSLDLLSNKKIVDEDEFIHISEANNIWIALINKRYKLVLTTRTSPWLFDLEKDPHETINCYEQNGYKDISEKMMKILVQRMKDYKEPIYSASKKIMYN